MNDADRKLIEEIEAREQKATPGKWEAYAGKLSEGFITIIYELQSRPGKTLIRWGGFDGIDLKKSQIINNLQFIAHGRTDIPALVALVRRMEREQDAMRKAAAYVCQPLEVQLSARDAEIAELRANLKRLSSSRASQELEARIKELEGLLEESEDLGNRIAGEVDAMVRKAVAEKDAEIARLKSEANPRE